MKKVYNRAFFVWSRLTFDHYFPHLTLVSTFYLLTINPVSFFTSWPPTLPSLYLDLVPTFYLLNTPFHPPHTHVVFIFYLSIRKNKHYFRKLIKVASLKLNIKTNNNCVNAQSLKLTCSILPAVTGLFSLEAAMWSETYRAIILEIWQLECSCECVGSSFWSSFRSLQSDFCLVAKLSLSNDLINKI